MVLQSPEGLTPQAAAAGEGDAETCLSSGIEGKESTVPVLPKEDRLREDPSPAASVVPRGHEKPAWRG